MSRQSLFIAGLLLVLAPGAAKSQHSTSEPTISWAHQYAPGLEYTDDFVREVGTDDDGNVYVLGSSDGFEHESIIAKYDPNGTLLWVKTVGGSDFGASGMVVDGAGNIHVTGNDWNAGAIATARYDANGVQQWVTRKGGVAVACEYLGFKTKLLDVDAAGNVVVSACQWEPDTGLPDLVTVKYDNRGLEQWAARYGGTDASGGTTNDWVVGVEFSESGDIYLAGGSRGPDIIDDNGVLQAPVDLKTIKYSSDGTEAWVASYSDSSIDESIATGLVVASDGGIVVTGMSHGQFGGELTTVKYTADGTEQWVAHYEGPSGSMPESRGIGIDRDDNVYVAGHEYDPATGRPFDFVTVKYSTGGAQQWRRSYDGGMDDILDMIEVDPSGNVFLTGTSRTERSLPGGEVTCGFEHLTLKYNADGQQPWAAVALKGKCGDFELPIVDVAIDRQSNLVTVSPLVDLSTGGYEWDFVTTEYDSEGVERWKATYRGRETPSLGQPTAMVLDAADNLIVTGWSEGGPTGRDIAVMKLSPDGEQLWVARYDGFGGTDEPAGIALDGAGNVYITGYSSIPNSGREDLDYLTLKFSATGEHLWDRTIDGPGGVYGLAVGLAVGPSGSVYVTGASSTGGSGEDGLDFTTIRYSPDGDVLWAANYDGGINGGDVARGIAVDRLENVFVSGWSRGSDITDFATVKYDANGVTQWSARHDSPEEGDEDTPAAIALDALGNVYVAGQTDENGGKYAVVKYDPTGHEQWVAQYGGPGDNWITDLLVDDSGDIVVTGGSSNDSGPDFATLRLSPSGSQLWVARFNGPANDFDGALALDRDEAGNVYVTGTTGSQRGALATVKYDVDGVHQWTAIYGGNDTSQSLHRPDESGSNPGDRVRGLAKVQDDLVFPGDVVVDASGSVYVAGSSRQVFTVVKYNQGGPVAVEADPELANLFLGQNYPNPFAQSTAFEFAIPEGAQVTLKIFNVLGQEVETLVDEWRAAGAHRVEWQRSHQPKGAYLYRLKAGNRVQARVMLVD